MDRYERDRRKSTLSEAEVRRKVDEFAPLFDPKPLPGYRTTEELLDDWGCKDALTDDDLLNRGVLIGVYSMLKGADFSGWGMNTRHRVSKILRFVVEHNEAAEMFAHKDLLAIADRLDAELEAESNSAQSIETKA